MMADQATYIRRQEDGRFKYTIESIPIGSMMRFEMGNGIFQLVFFFIIGFIVVMGVSGVVFQRSTFLFLLAMLVYFALFYYYAKSAISRFKKKSDEYLGRRGRTKIDLSSEEVVAAFEPSRAGHPNVAVKQSEVRRIRITNTMDRLDLRGSDISRFGQALAQPTQATAAAVMQAHAAGDARRAKVRKVCFAVILNFGNTSVALADGLDELTAENLFDDFLADSRSLLSQSGNAT